MPLTCECVSDGSDWYYEEPDDYTRLTTKRSRTCCSCLTKISVDDVVVQWFRWRPPTDRCNYIEESIYGDEVPLAPWYMCEGCGDQYFNLKELGFCISPDENMLSLVSEYAELKKTYS